MERITFHIKIPNRPKPVKVNIPKNTKVIDLINKFIKQVNLSKTELGVEKKYFLYQTKPIFIELESEKTFDDYDSLSIDSEIVLDSYLNNEEGIKEKNTKFEIYKNVGVSPSKPENSEDAIFWKKIVNSNDISLYQKYLKKFPTGLYVDNANDKIKIIQLESKSVSVPPPVAVTSDQSGQVFTEQYNDWIQAITINSEQSINEFIAKYPTGHFKEAAGIKVEHLKSSSVIQSKEDEIEQLNFQISNLQEKVDKYEKELESINTEWNQFISCNQKEDYQNFINILPASRYVDIAQSKIDYENSIENFSESEERLNAERQQITSLQNELERLKNVDKNYNAEIQKNNNLQKEIENLNILIQNEKSQSIQNSEQIVSEWLNIDKSSPEQIAEYLKKYASIPNIAEVISTYTTAKIEKAEDVIAGAIELLRAHLKNPEQAISNYNQKVNQAQIQNQYKPQTHAPVVNKVEQIQPKPQTQSEIDVDEIKFWWNGLNNDWKKGLLKNISINGKPNLKNIISLIKLKKVNLSGEVFINELSPLKMFENLRSVDCSNTSVNSLSPISDINSIEVLNISNTRVINLSPLKNLKNLKILNCSNTQVSSLKAIANHQELEELYCSETMISNEEIEEFKNTHNCIVN